MKPKTFILLAVAVGCGLVAMLGVQQAMQATPAPVKLDTTQVLVALDNIEVGMRLTPDNTTTKEIATSSVPEDAARTTEDVSDRAAKVPLMAGDIVRKTKLTEKGEWGKSVAIPAGMRVIGIPVDDSNTISGLIRPGDRVDVLVTYQGRGERGTTVSKTKTLLEYVEVFGMDDQTASKIDDGAKGMRAKIAALLLTPEQTGYVILAQRKGVLSLSWRRRSDDELAQTKDVDERLMEELQGTVGIPEGGNSIGYQRSKEFSIEEGESEPGPEAVSPQQFLSDTTSAAPVSILPPAGETWTVEVYIGNESQPQQFQLPPPEFTPESRSSSPEKLDQTLLNPVKNLLVR